MIIFFIKNNNYLASLYFEKNSIGIALIDISTGEFFNRETQGNSDYIDKLLQSFPPARSLYPKTGRLILKNITATVLYTTPLMNGPYQRHYANETFIKALRGSSLKGSVYRPFKPGYCGRRCGSALFE